MAKDKLGHGSEKRGVSAVQARNDRMHAMFDRAKAQGHTTFNAERDAAAAREKAIAYAQTPNATPLDVIRASHDYEAARELARGSQKSAVVPAHTSTISGNQMDAYLRYARGFTGTGAVKEPSKRNVGSDK